MKRSDNEYVEVETLGVETGLIIFVLEVVEKTCKIVSKKHYKKI